MAVKLRRAARSPWFPLCLLLTTLLPCLIFQGALWRNVWGIQYLRAAPPPAEWPARALAQQPRLRLWLAQDAVAQADWAQAARWLEPLRSEEAGALRRDAQRLQGMVWDGQGRAEEAIALWQQTGSTSLLLDAARRAEAAGRYGLALQAYAAAHAVDPELALDALARFLWHTMQEPAEAEALLRGGIESAPARGARAGWLQTLGALYRDQARWGDAESVYTALGDLEPTGTVAPIQLGWLSYERGDGAAAALAHFQQAIVLAPRRADGYLAVAQLFMRQQEYAAADPWLLEALARGDSLSGWLTYAANAGAQARWDEAITRYTAIAARYPEAHALYYQLAGAYLQAQRLDDASAALAKAIELAGAQPPAAYASRAAEIRAAEMRAAEIPAPENRGADGRR